MEDAELKVEQCRDQLASEMFQLISREAELAKTIVEFARLQKLYHERALSVLDEFLPDLEAVVCESLYTCSFPYFLVFSTEGSHLSVVHLSCAHR